MPAPSNECALQVLLAEAIALAAPDVGASAGDAHAALPRERLAVRGGVRLLDVVAEPVRVVLGAGVAVLLRRLRAADQIVGARAVLQLVGGLVLGVVAVLERPAGADQRDAQARFAHALGGPSTGRARPDDDDVDTPAAWSAPARRSLLGGLNGLVARALYQRVQSGATHEGQIATRAVPTRCDARSLLVTRLPSDESASHAEKRAISRVIVLGKEGSDAGPCCRRCMAGAGASVAVPALAHEHPLHEALQNPAKVGAADRKASAPALQAAAPRQAPLRDARRAVRGDRPGLDEGQGRRVHRRPRSRSSCPRRSAASSRRSARWRAWRSPSIASRGRALTAAEQVALLTKASTAEAPPRGAGGPGSPAAAAGPRPAATLSIREQFEHLKGWISGAYYSTEIGMRELGWNGNVFFAQLPECGPLVVDLALGLSGRLERWTASRLTASRLTAHPFNGARLILSRDPASSGRQPMLAA